MVKMKGIHTIQLRKCRHMWIWRCNEPSPVGWVVMNVDTSLFHKARMGLGIVIRNHREEFLAACRHGIDKIINPKLAEAIAFRWGILLAYGLPYKQIMIATNSLFD